MGHCTIRGQDFKVGSDGVTVEDNGRKCVAHVGSGGSHLHAVAICVPENEYKVVKARNGRANCPGGYTQVNCAAHSFWATQKGKPGQPLGGMDKLGKFDARAQLKKGSNQPCEARCRDPHCDVFAFCRRG